MKNFVGIDLGTTNSAICSYDGSETQIWKSPGENNDITPSAITFAKRGNKYLGSRAYNSAPWQHENAAVLFKRLMGTSTPIKISSMNLSMTPEECSSEILKLLFGYLPEEMRNDPDVGTVITVPAAFNQMQKDATMQAATMAGIGKVALMQEPVAAVMSVMRANNADGIFLIYDLGGGTLDIAIAESISGRINLLAHGGIAMCGGRDFDRLIMNNIVRPWMHKEFELPDNFAANPEFATHNRVALWAIEKAKIELSAREESTIFLSEDEMRNRDLADNDIYLEIPLSRGQYDRLIAEKLKDTIDAARETLSKTGLSPHDLERIVFVGGPTNYKPLRDSVAFELGIPGSTDVNPMTAVAEGASLFAESIDWSSKNRSRKTNRGELFSGGALDLNFRYEARTPKATAKIGAQLAGQSASGYEFQIDSIDTGWTSGRLSLQHGAIVDVALPKAGENAFKVFVFDSVGGSINLEQNKIIITRTAATVDAIPASHSIFVEALNKLGGRPEPSYLVRAGEFLPKKGKQEFKAGESLKAGAVGSLNFKLWEGEIDSIQDNRPIGVLRISGKDFDAGVIPAGGTLECDFEVLDSGNVILEISIPDIQGIRSGNFYSWQEGIGGRNYDSEGARAYVVEEGDKTVQKIDDIEEVVQNPKLASARKKLESAASLDPHESDPESAKEAHEKILEAKTLLSQVRKEHLPEIRQIDLDGVASFFDEHIRQHARPSEATAFDNLAKTAQRSIDHKDKDFEHHLDELKGKNFQILWRQDWFVVERFKWMASSPHLFADRPRFEELSKIGSQLMRSDDIGKLREVVYQLSTIQIDDGPDDEMFDVVNIIRG
jgi:molecular chaperone DnaK